MIVPMIFGTTSGFELLPLGDLWPPIDDVWLECSPTELAIQTGTENYCVLRHDAKDEDGEVTWIGLYRSAKEIGRSRSGGYYGAGIVLVNLKVDSALAVRTLKFLADQVYQLAIVEDQFVKRLADIQSLITIPPELSRFQLGKKALTNEDIGLLPSKPAGFICADSSSALKIIDWAQSGEAAEVLGKVFIGAKESFPKNSSQILGENFYDCLEAAEASCQQKLRIKRLEERLGEIKNQAVNERRISEERIANLNNVVKIKEAESNKLTEHVKSLEKKFDGLKHRSRSGPWRDTGLFLLGALTIITALTLTTLFSPKTVRNFLPKDAGVGNPLNEPSSQDYLNQPATRIIELAPPSAARCTDAPSGSGSQKNIAGSGAVSQGNCNQPSTAGDGDRRQTTGQSQPSVAHGRDASGTTNSVMETPKRTAPNRTTTANEAKKPQTGRPSAAELAPAQPPLNEPVPTP